MGQQEVGGADGLPEALPVGAAGEGPGGEPKRAREQALERCSDGHLAGKSARLAGGKSGYIYPGRAAQRFEGRSGQAA